MLTTKLWFEKPNGVKKLMATITPDSKFFRMNIPKDVIKAQGTKKGQEKIAMIIKSGWVTNAGMDSRKFSITQADEPSAPFSLETEAIMDPLDAIL